MNAPATTLGHPDCATAEAGLRQQPRFEALPLGAIRPSETRTQKLRRSLFDDLAIDGLAASIARQGLAQPIVVRELAEPDGFVRYELVAGEQRWLASKKAGLDLIQAVIRDLDDDQVLELQLAENLQRDTLHPLVEATGYQEMIATQQLTVEAVAEHVGKSKAWVYNRLKLLALAEAPRKALLDGALSPSVALRIARITTAEQQGAAFARIMRGPDPTRVGEPMTDREAAEYIREHFMRELRGVAFKLDDATLLPAAGSCTACPKRSGNLGDLFTEVKNPNVCTDTQCLEAKLDAHGARVRAELDVTGTTVISGSAARKIKPALDAKLKGYVKPDDVVMVGEQLKSYRDALGEDLPLADILEDPFTRELVPVVKAGAMKEALARAGIKGASRSYDASAKKKAEDKARIESAVRFRLLAEIRTKAAGAEDVQMIAQYMFAGLTFDAQKRLVDSRIASNQGEGTKILPKGHDHVTRFPKTIAQMKPGELAGLLRDIALVGQCHVSPAVKPEAKELFATAKRLGIKDDKVREAVEKELAAPVQKKGRKVR